LAKGIHAKVCAESRRDGPKRHPEISSGRGADFLTTLVQIHEHTSHKRWIARAAPPWERVFSEGESTPADLCGPRVTARRFHDRRMVDTQSNARVAAAVSRVYNRR